MKIARSLRSLCGIILASSSLLTLPALAQTEIGNSGMSLVVTNHGVTYEVRAKGIDKPVVSARVGVMVNHQWIWSTDYPKPEVESSEFHDQLGGGHRLTVKFAATQDKPELGYTLELYDKLQCGDIQVHVANRSHAPVEVQAIRVLDASGAPIVNLGGAEKSERVLSDSFSEDRPPLHIFDLGKARFYEGEDSYSDKLSDVHFAVGSQLIYNGDSRYSLFVAALTSERWLTVFHLGTENGNTPQVRAKSYSVDCTGTTEVMKKESIRDDFPKQQVELSLAVKPEDTLASEKILLTVGQDYHDQLESYGSTIRQLRKARVSKPAPWGWWSWTAYYYGLTGGAALTNAEWLAQHLKGYGYDLFHIDEGYAYGDSEFTTPNADLYPNGIRGLGYKATSMGLRFGMWVAPFRVSVRSYVYQNHLDWLVHDAKGKPIQIGFVQDGRDALYVLDATHPGAQEYLRQVYRTLSREWNARYFKMDFMDDTAIEGYHYRPNTSAIEALQIGLNVIREAVGPDVLLDKDGCPMLAAVGYTDLGRTSTDTGHSYAGTREDATGIAARYYMNGNFYTADPDAFTVSEQLITDQSWHTQKDPLSLNEAEVSIGLAAIAGGMFEIGDDLPTLGTHPERLNLLQNEELLNMVRLRRAAKPVDLMTYRDEDGQPSVFYLRESNRQAMLIVFNWTESKHDHNIVLADLGWKGTASVTDIFHAEDSVKVSGGTVQIAAQAPRSVRILKLVNDAIAAEAPKVEIKTGGSTDIAKDVEFTAAVDPAGVPATSYHWEFGDGTGEDGPSVTHAYTRKGPFEVSLKVQGIDGKSATQKQTVTIGGSLRTTFEVQNSRRYEEKQ